MIRLADQKKAAFGEHLVVVVVVVVVVKGKGTV